LLVSSTDEYYTDEYYKSKSNSIIARLSCRYVATHRKIWLHPVG
jgi:hypothetical protein